MDLRALRYFRTVAECGSFSRASEMLRISQPAVSRTIRELEAELGKELLERGRDGARLTESGRILFEHSAQLLRQVEQAANDVRRGATVLTGRLTIGMPPGVGHLLAPPLLARFSAAHEQVEIKIVGGFSSQLRDLLARRQLDLAFAHDPLPQRGLKVTPLLREEVFVVGLPGSLGGGTGGLPSAEIVKLPLILPSRPNASRRLLDAWAAREGLWIDARYEVDDHVITSGLVKRGLGVSLMTRATLAAGMLAGEIDIRPIAPRAYWPLALVELDLPSPSGIATEFARIAREIVREMTEQGSWPGAIGPG